MKITVLFFAGLRETLGVAHEQLDLPESVDTAGGLRAWLRQRGEPWVQALAEGRAVRVAVNQVMADDAAPIADGAEVAFFPPVTGG